MTAWTSPSIPTTAAWDMQPDGVVAPPGGERRDYQERC